MTETAGCTVNVCATNARKLLFGFLVFDIVAFIVYYANAGISQGTVFLQDVETERQNVGTVNLGFWNTLFRSTNLTVNSGQHFADPDIHEEVSVFGHVWDSSENISLKIDPRDIAIGLGITTRSNRVISNIGLYPFFKSFLPSFCKTSSNGYNYNFFLAYDNTDAKLSKKAFVAEWANQFIHITGKQCPKGSNFSIHFVQCAHSRKPAWAQNDAMIEAYLNNMAYYYRINDDTVMESAGWTEAFINQLKFYDPKNVGVVGPKHRGGNTAILTYDFVHITHVDIHGFYYPRIFPQWYADRWISDVYKPGRSTKMAKFKIKHTMEQGQRYRNKPVRGADIKGTIESGRETIQRYINTVKAKHPKPSGDKVISMALWGLQPKYTFGAVRNAQLMPILFPDWILRIYVSKKSDILHVPPRVLNKLQVLGAHVVFVNSSAETMPPERWRYLVALDSSVTHFLIRDADSRFTEREAKIIGDWLISGKPFHCIRDNAKHTSHAITDGLWGAKLKDVENLLGVTWKTLILQPNKTLSKNNTSGNTNATAKKVDFNNYSILNSFIWPRIQNSSFCHDSVSCLKWPHSVKFPQRRNSSSFVGQSYGPFGDVDPKDIKSSRLISDDQCSETT